MMRSMIRWTISQTPAMNTLVVSLLVLGIYAAFQLRREVFPQFDLEIILIQVPYPGASPDEVESGICQKIEEAVRSVEGVKKVTCVAAEGIGNVIIEVRTDVPSVQKVLNDVQSEVDRIPSFPDLSEEPKVQQLSFRRKAITVGVVLTADETQQSDLKLREVVEGVRDDLLLIPQISSATIVGERKYQIDVEIPEETLREYGLTLQDVARRIRARNLELPGGTIRDRGETYLLRGKDKRVLGDEIESIPLITQPDGAVLRVSDLGVVRDEFVDTTSISRINGRPGLAIEVNAASKEDLLAMTESVREYVAKKGLPSGFEFVVWGDSSIEVKDRLDMLKSNGMQGLVLVFIILALFMDLQLAFWVAMGIPISLLATCAVLWQFDQTLNMLSLFSFLIALGIVVDDAIVIGENISTHRSMGKGPLQAALDGTVEVVPSVFSSVATTIFAFVPMFFVTGVMGKFFAIIPLAVISILTISLLEATFIFPCHLAHGVSWVATLNAGLNRFSNSVLNFVVRIVYEPLVRAAISRPTVTVSIAIVFLLLSVGLVTSGRVPRIVFPKLDTPEVMATVTFPDGTPSSVTEEATLRMEKAIQEVNRKVSRDGQPAIEVIHRMVGIVNEDTGVSGPVVEGSHVGSIYVQLVDSQYRDVTSEEIVAEWRALTGTIPGVENIKFGSISRGPGGKPIEFKLLASAEQMHELEQAVEEVKKQLSTYEGAFDVSDDSTPGKWELQLREKPSAVALGVPLDQIARTVRAAYYGEEVMRLQRGRHEVKLMVRYPESDRKSLARFSEIRVDAGDGIQRPITELAQVAVTRGYSEINRVDQKRSITISADVDEATGNAADIVANLQREFMPQLLQKYPAVRVRWEGQQEQDIESIRSLGIGLAIALLAMFVLLTMEFTSYGQPLVVMAIIPFGLVGAIWGHWVLGLPLTLFSVLGLVALTGVVVNDSIVLVDFINSRVREGVPVREAILESGQRRLRPVMLTSLTTIAGLLPILLEQSYQAQLVIPMAASLCFGLMTSTVLVLVLVPTFYLIYVNLFGVRVAAAADHSEAPSPAPDSLAAL